MGESTDGIVLKHLQTLYSVGAIGGLSDGQLWDHVLAGRDDDAEAAFTILAERHGPMVLRICRQMLGDRHEAEDAFQATFLVLASKGHSIRNRDSAASWLHGVARRVVLRARADAARRRIHERRAAILAVEDSPDEGRRDESWPELHEEIARLPERYREPIVLCYLEGLTTEAASQRLGCPQGTVLSRLSRARERLRKSLTRRGVVVPAGLLAAELCSEVAMAVPAALLHTTVRASLSFAARQAAGASLASTTAIGLARGVLYAMTLSQWKTIGAATLACVLAMGGLRAFAQFGGIGVGEKAPAAEPVDDDRQTALSRSVAKIQAELNEATRRNAELGKQLRAIQAELKTLQTVQIPSKDAKSTERAQSTPIKRPAGDSGATKNQAQGVPNGNEARIKYIKQDNIIFAVSPLGDKIKIYNTETTRSRTLELPASEEFPLEVTPIFAPGVAALMLKGPKITRIAASQSLDSPWLTQDLREPVVGMANPIVGGGIVVYSIDKYIYAFSSEARRWGILELPKGREVSPQLDSKTVTVEAGDHIYTFDIGTAEWNDLDLRAILDAPDGNESEDAEPARSQPGRHSRPIPGRPERRSPPETPEPGPSRP